MKMDLIMEKRPEVISIHNDIMIYGTSKEDHDSNLVNLLSMAQLEGLVLNSKKLELKRPRVSFFRAEYSVDGMHPCPKKIQGITKMTPPIDKTAGQFHWNGDIHGEFRTTSLSSYSKMQSSTGIKWQMTVFRRSRT